MVLPFVHLDRVFCLLQDLLHLFVSVCVYECVLHSIQCVYFAVKVSCVTNC